MIDYKKTIISQYANSPTINRLIENMDDCIKPDADIASFYNTVFNIDTATTYGLDCWGKIVGVDRNIAIATPVRGLGFRNAGVGIYKPFNYGTFFNGSTTNNFRLSDDAYRQLICAKALVNITVPSVIGINKILKKMFPDTGNPHVVDGLNMTMSYTFDFTLTPLQNSLVYKSGILPRPSGVDDGQQGTPTAVSILGFREAGTFYKPLGWGRFSTVKFS
jgi:hypothetical protein